MSLTYRVHPCTSLRGTLTPPGDKSISHRCVLFSSLATGTSRFQNVLFGDDVLATMQIMRQLGITVDVNKERDELFITSPGLGLLDEPREVLECRNSGTCARLVLGALASHPVQATLNGDISLNSRPMQRVIEPLGLMGAECHARDDKFLPMHIKGRDDLVPVSYRLPVASAQIKSAILIAALNTRGVTEIIEPVLCRDHTERLLPLFGAVLDCDTDDNGDRRVSCEGQHELNAINFTIPGDISSAAFPLVAALVVNDSQIVIDRAGLNPTRTGILVSLARMGAEIAIDRKDEIEPYGTLTVRSTDLKGTKIETDPATMIDEYPILSVAAATANGETLFEGIGELRFKESDRIACMEEALQACGVSCDSGPDWMRIHGNRAGIRGGISLDARHDHRLAMSFIVLGLVADAPIKVTGAETIATSYPNFIADMRSLGAEIEDISQPETSESPRDPGSSYK